MSDEISSLDGFDELDLSELSEEDLAILQAFEAMDTWSAGQPHPATNDQNKTPRASQALSPHEDEEMLLIFITEAEEDICSLRQVLNQLEQDKSSNPACFITMKRAGHKLHGTAGAGYEIFQSGKPSRGMCCATTEILTLQQIRIASLSTNSPLANIAVSQLRCFAPICLI